MGVVDPISGWALPAPTPGATPQPIAEEVSGPPAGQVGRFSIITIDQAVSGGSNVLAGALAARILGPELFGLWGIVFLVAASVQGAVRALVCEPLLVHPAEAEERPGEAIGTAIGLGVVMGAAITIIGAVARIWDGRLGVALITLGVLFPAVVIQDVGRYLGIAIHKPVRTLALDATWLLVMVVAMGFLIAGGTKSLAATVAVWLGAGSVAGLLTLWQYRHSDAIRFGRAWLSETWGFAWRYLAAFSATQASTLAASLALAGIAGAAAFGAVQGSLLLFSPATMFQLAAGSAGVAEMARVTDAAGIRRHSLRISVLCAIGTVLTAAVLLGMPDSLGRAALGDTWASAEPLLFPAAIYVTLLGLFLGPKAGLLGSRAVHRSLRVDLVMGPVLVVGAVVGTLANDAVGYYWGVIAVLCAIVPAWWLVLRHHLRGGLDRGPVPPTDTLAAEGGTP